MAQASPDAEFTIGGVNVTNSLDQFGVVLGSDLAGASTTAMMEIGAGVVYDITDRFYLDAEFRYNRVFTDAAIPFGRAGAGIGIRFGLCGFQTTSLNRTLRFDVQTNV